MFMMSVWLVFCSCLVLRSSSLIFAIQLSPVQVKSARASSGGMFFDPRSAEHWHYCRCALFKTRLCGLLGAA